MDFEVCTRQEIGNWWVPQRNDEALANEILQGNLELSPHKSCKFEAPFDWNSDPLSQKNWRFQLHCLKWLEPVRRVALGRSHAEGDRSKYAEYWYTVAHSWLEGNLHGDDRFAWMDMADGLRAIELILGASLFPENQQDELKEAIEIHLQKLSDLTRRVPGNHELHQVQGMFVAARFLENNEASATAAQQLGALFGQQWDLQGTNSEGSLAYHDLNYHWWNVALKRLEVEGFKIPNASEVLSRSRLALAQFVRPNGYLETIGDTAPERPMSEDGTNLSTFAVTAGREGNPPEKLNIILDAGYAAGRSTWGSDPESFSKSDFYSLVWGGKRVHGHDDGSSFTIFANETPWIVDPGMYAYQSDQYRSFFLGKTSHNRIATHARIPLGHASSLVANAENEDFEYFHLRIDDFPAYVLYRYFVYLKKFKAFVVADYAAPDDPNRSILDLFSALHFLPETDVFVGKRTVTLFNDDKTATIRFLFRPRFETFKGSTMPLQGWFSPSYAKVEKATALEVYPTKRGQQQWFSVISVGDCDVVPLEASITGESLFFRYTVDGEEKRFSSPEP